MKKTLKNLKKHYIRHNAKLKVLDWKILEFIHSLELSFILIVTTIWLVSAFVFYVSDDFITDDSNVSVSELMQTQAWKKLLDITETDEWKELIKKIISTDEWKELILNILKWSYQNPTWRWNNSNDAIINPTWRWNNSNDAIINPTWRWNNL